MLRRFRKHITEQNWIALAFDFLIVVVGVFLGLQAQDWNQSRVDRQSERAYLERLTDDFAQLSKELESCMNIYEGSLAALEHISSVVFPAAGIGPQTDMQDGAKIRDSLLRMTAGAIPAGRSVTFVEMLSSGDLRILRDESLRRELIYYDQVAEAHREIWRSLRGETADYGRPVYSATTLSVDLEARQMVTVGDFDLDAMANSSEFRTMVTVFAGNNANAYELCQRQLGLAAGVLNKLGRD
ncbi:MAG: hypothetical protein AAFX56_20400 [Pseudomonadota bacterium]